jgi:glucose-6-phosphate 1-dehydrogenase
METIKFFILGISGNLAKEKVLPALGQFHGLYGDQINIEVHGYSRSEANLAEIQKLTCLANSSSCPRIKLYNGEYENNQVYHDLISGLKENERLVVYLAIPPSIFIKFLQNSCPYGQHKIDILMEKPFGANENEANQIIKIIEACDLGDKVHFIDHYWFKNSARADFNIIADNLKLDISKLKKIKIQALEKIDIGSRKGFYDQTGATKDMLVHLYSLLNLSKKLFENLDFAVSINKVTNLKLGQYESYQSEIDDSGSLTETYFNINTEFKYQEKNVEIEFESGKKLQEKITKITLEFDDQTVEYTLAPESNIKIHRSGKEDEIINIEDPKTLDHNNVFFDVWHNEFSRFVPKDEVINGWKVFNKVKEFRDDNKIQVEKY